MGIYLIEETLSGKDLKQDHELGYLWNSENEARGAEMK